jgi:hypothetical protein
MKAMNLPPIGGVKSDVRRAGFCARHHDGLAVRRDPPAFWPGRVDSFLRRADRVVSGVRLSLDVHPGAARLPTMPTCISVVWGLPEIIIAAIAGAWAYTES